MSCACSTGGACNNNSRDGLRPCDTRSPNDGREVDILANTLGTQKQTKTDDHHEDEESREECTRGTTYPYPDEVPEYEAGRQELRLPEPRPAGSIIEDIFRDTL